MNTYICNGRNRTGHCLALKTRNSLSMVVRFCNFQTLLSLGPENKDCYILHWHFWVPIRKTEVDNIKPLIQCLVVQKHSFKNFTCYRTNLSMMHYHKNFSQNIKRGNVDKLMLDQHFNNFFPKYFCSYSHNYYFTKYKNVRSF